MESEFYATLRNNSSVQYFPDNKASNFVTKLSRTLQLDGEWEVGLAEIDYPHTWYNIREGKNSVEIYVTDKWAQEFSIPPGYYENVIDCIAQSWTRDKKMRVLVQDGIFQINSGANRYSIAKISIFRIDSRSNRDFRKIEMLVQNLDFLD